MLSRVAHSLYWMRRYVERADQIARVVGVNMDLAFDRAPLEVVQLWGRLLSGLWSAPVWAQVSRESPPDALSDLTNIDAVASCFAAARENARQIRQHITGEMWDRLNGVHLALNDAARRAEWSQRPHGFFQTVREAAALFDAAIDDGMARDEAWHFLQLGQFLERSAATARLLECQLRATLPAHAPDRLLDEQLEWICLLRACDALELYRRRNRTDLGPEHIVRFLIADQRSPRSIRYGFDRIEETLAALAEAVPSQPAVIVGSVLADAIRSLETRDGDAIEAVCAIQAECDRIHRTVHETYIDHQRTVVPVASERTAWITR
jgi:uncharacterized alpha-E superfamily protein